jgi:O-antigen/teichoic acid export membrane protein
MSESLAESQPGRTAIKPPATRGFSTNVALTLGARLIVLAAILGVSVIAARKLGPEGYGFLAVLSVMLALATQIGSAGLPSANTYFLSRDQGRLRRIAITSLKFGLLIGTGLAIALVMLARFRPSVFGDVPFALVVIAAGAIPFQLLTLLGLNLFLATGDIDRMNLLDAAGQVVLFLNAVFVLLLVNGNIATLVAANTIGAALIALVIVTIIARTIAGAATTGTSAEPHLLQQMVRYSFKFHIAIVVGVLIVRADLLLVNHFRGAAEAGPYAVASQIANTLLLLPAIISTLLFPRVAAEADPQAQFTARVTRHAALIMLIVCLVTALLSFLLPIVYGWSFSDATPLLLILLPGIYLYGIEAVLVQHFTGTGLPLMVPVFWLITLAFNLTLNFIFIPTFGAPAAAVISTLSYALIFLLVAIYFRRQTGIKLSEALVIKRGEISSLPAMVSGLCSRYRPGLSTAFPRRRQD